MRRRKAAPPEPPPAETAAVIVLAHVRAGIVRRPRFPAARPAGVPGGRAFVATLLPFARPACPA